MATVNVVVKIRSKFNGPDHKSLGFKEVGEVITITDGPYFESLVEDGFVDSYLDTSKELNSETLNAVQVKSQKYDLKTMHISKLRSLAAVLGMRNSVGHSKADLIKYIEDTQNPVDILEPSTTLSDLGKMEIHPVGE